VRLATIGKLLVLISVIFFTGCATYTSVREHSALDSVAKNIQTVVIAPPQVNIELRVFTGENEPLTDKENTIREQLITVAQRRLKSEGLEVIDFDFAQAIANDDDFAFALTQAKEALNKAEKDLYNGKSVALENKRQFNVSLGPAVNEIAEQTGAEAVLLIDYYGFEKSAGLKTKDIAAGVLLAVLLGGSSAAIAPPSGSFVDLALVDTASGDILWTNRRGGQIVDTSIAEHALNELPDVVWEGEVVADETAEFIEKTDIENGAHQEEATTNNTEVALPSDAS